MRFETTHCEMTKERESFPDSGFTFLSENPHMVADTIPELLAEVCSLYGFDTPSTDRWDVNEDYIGISTCFLVDEYNNQVTHIKQGKVNLWILDLYIGIRCVESRNPTEDEFKPFTHL